MDSTMTTMFVGQVYKIWSSECDKCYVGSTKQLLRNRLSKHKKDFRAWQKGKYPYVTSFEILAHDDAEIELLEEREFGDKQEMLECEKYWVQTLDAVNNRSPITTRDERLQQMNECYYRNKEQRLEQMKKYYAGHKVQKTEYDKNRPKVPCPHCQHMMAPSNLKQHIQAKHAQE